MRPEMPPLRILMVLEAAYPAIHGGGAETQVRTLSSGLRARGQRVTVLALRQATGDQRSVFRLDGVPVCRLDYPRVRGLSSIFMCLALSVFLYRRRCRYDAWHVHIAHYLGAVCALMGRRFRIPVLTKVSGWWELEKGTLAPSTGLLNWLAYRCVRHTDTWQAISHRIATTLIERGIPASRIAEIPNAVDTSRFANIVRTPEAPVRFVFIGRLAPEKGLHALLEAFSDITAAYPAASLLLVGAGSLLDQLQREAQALAIADRVTFAGHQDDIETQLASGNVGVLCSRIEGLSNTLLESMASGLPMVASRISGNEDFVRHGENGWLFEDGDRAGLARCLGEAAALAPSERAAMGERARATVRQKAGLDNVLDQLIALYRHDASFQWPLALPPATAKRST